MLQTNMSLFNQAPNKFVQYFPVLIIFLIIYVVGKDAFFASDNIAVDEAIIKKYQVQAQQRIDILRDRIKSEGIGILYNALVPEVFCKNLVRIGQVGEGGKWICNPTSMLEWSKCNIYSLGTSNDPSFEEDLQTLLNNKCTVRSLDKDTQSLKTMKRIKKIKGKFKQAEIGGTKNQSANIYTFRDLLLEFDDKRIDILKIDIEGGEFDIINELIAAPICQILIEVHGKTPEEILKFLQTFSENGFYLFSYEINGFHHQNCDFSLIHVTCFDLFHIQTVYGKFLSE